MTSKQEAAPLAWQVPPAIVAAMGGAQRYAYDGAAAVVIMPGGEWRRVPMTRATFDLQTAFTLADLAAPVDENWRDRSATYGRQSGGG